MSASFVIEPLDFVRNAGEHRGKASPGTLARLQSYLFDDHGELTYSVSGLLDEINRPMLRILVKGKINLCCQRCLGKLEQSFDLNVDFLLVKRESELHQYDDEDGVDALLIVPEMDVMLLVEDDVILNLPISPCHLQNECSEENLISKSEKLKQDVAKHPFAALAALKKLH
jgi:uncharacterized protein